MDFEIKLVEYLELRYKKHILLRSQKWNDASTIRHLERMSLLEIPIYSEYEVNNHVHVEKYTLLTDRIEKYCNYVYGYPISGRHLGLESNINFNEDIKKLSIRIRRDIKLAELGI